MKSNENVVSVQIPEKDLETIMKKAQELQNLLKPYLIALRPEERQRGLKMSDKSLPFVEKAAEYAKTCPDFTPPYMEVEELAIDIKAVNDLTQVYRQVDQLCQGLNDTIMQSGSEAFAEALAYYNSVKQAAKMNRPNAKAVYEDLKKRFERNR